AVVADDRNDGRLALDLADREVELRQRSADRETQLGGEEQGTEQRACVSGGYRRICLDRSEGVLRELRSIHRLPEGALRLGLVPAQVILDRRVLRRLHLLGGDLRGEVGGHGVSTSLVVLRRNVRVGAPSRMYWA